MGLQRFTVFSSNSATIKGQSLSNFSLVNSNYLENRVSARGRWLVKSDL